MHVLHFPGVHREFVAAEIYLYRAIGTPGTKGHFGRVSTDASEVHSSPLEPTIVKPEGIGPRCERAAPESLLAFLVCELSRTSRRHYVRETEQCDGDQKSSEGPSRTTRLASGSDHFTFRHGEPNAADQARGRRGKPAPARVACSRIVRQGPLIQRPFATAFRKCLSKNSAASRSPSSLSATDFALLLGSEIQPCS